MARMHNTQRTTQHAALQHVFRSRILQYAIKQNHTQAPHTAATRSLAAPRQTRHTRTHSRTRCPLIWPLMTCVCVYDRHPAFGACSSTENCAVLLACVRVCARVIWALRRRRAPPLRRSGLVGFVFGVKPRWFIGRSCSRTNAHMYVWICVEPGPPICVFDAWLF